MFKVMFIVYINISHIYLIILSINKINILHKIYYGILYTFIDKINNINNNI